MKVRQSSGCVVYRRTKGQLWILLVTSRSGKKWVFPKGGVEPNMSPEASACKEVREEAGVVCDIEQELGTYRFIKDGVLQVVRMYGAQYVSDTEVWEECNVRNRQWMTISDALASVDEYLGPFVLDVQSLLEG